MNPHTVFTFGGYARQDQYNYYPSRDPFADWISGRGICKPSGRVAG